MNEPATAPVYRGIFNRDQKGESVPAVTVRLERGQMQFYAQVLEETRPVFTDVEAARAAGYPDIVAPPAFFTVIDAMASEELKRQAEAPATERIGCDYRYLLHGDETYEYVSALFAGDEVSVTTLIADFYDKKGGAMEFAVLRSTVEHAERGVLLRAQRTLLHRLG